MPHLWKQHINRGLECSIEIPSTKTRSEVTKNHAVRIEHWNSLDNEHLPQFLCLYSVSTDKLQEAVHHMAAIRLSWVNPSRYDDAFFVSVRH